MGAGDTKSILAAAGLCLALIFGAAGAVAQDDREHALVLKLGPAGEWPSHERANFGGTVAVVSPTFEFMIGAGPSVSRTLNGEDQSTTVSAAFTLDFMFWPTPNIGWFVEPTWTVNPRNGQQSFAASVGLLIGIPQR